MRVSIPMMHDTMFANGTHKGQIMGIPPTGKRVNVTEMRFFRIANCKLPERWGESDMLGLMQQLGIIPAQQKS